MAGTLTDRRTGTSSAGPTTDRRIGVSGSVAVKAPVRACALTNITLSGLQTVDGVSLAADDRVLVAGQTSSVNNGVYLSSTGNWQRAPDFDDNHDVVKGSIIHVTDGTSNSGLYALTTEDDVEFDTDNITFANLLTLIGASSLLAANNLSDVADAFASLRNLMENGTTIVSASPLDLSAAGGDFVDVSGNTGISAVTLAEGKSQWVRFTGTPTITVGASLIGNNGGSNVTIAAGDWVLFRGYAAGVVRFQHFAIAGITAQVAAASETVAGKVELATNAETQTGTDTARAITPANLTAKEASAANFRANTADRILTTDIAWSAADEVTLTDAATIAVDMSTFINAKVTLGGNRTLGQPSNTKVGQCGVIRIIQDGTGSRTLAYHSDWKFAGGTDPVLSTPAGTTDLLFYQVVAANVIFASLAKGIA